MPTHEQRAIAESFGADADRYDRARPRYPQAMIDKIVATAPGPSVLDVGIGTGIAARQLTDAGCQVLGVDVDPRMAAVASRYGLDVEVSPFESWDPAGRLFDAVVAGQTWHWIDPNAGAVAAAEVLRPGGLLALFWNVAQPEAAAGAAIADVYRKAIPELPAQLWERSALDTYQVMFDTAAGGIDAAGQFGDVSQWRFDWKHTYTRDEWLDQIPSHGGMSRLSHERLAGLLDSLKAVLGPTVPVDYATVVVASTKR